MFSRAPLWLSTGLDEYVLTASDEHVLLRTIAVHEANTGGRQIDLTMKIN